MLKFNPFKSLTIWGALGAVGSVLAGTLVSVLGLRNAHAKAVAQLAATIEQLAQKSAGR